MELHILHRTFSDLGADSFRKGSPLLGVSFTQEPTVHGTSTEQIIGRKHAPIQRKCFG